MEPKIFHEDTDIKVIRLFYKFLMEKDMYSLWVKEMTKFVSEVKHRRSGLINPYRFLECVPWYVQKFDSYKREWRKVTNDFYKNEIEENWGKIIEVVEQMYPVGKVEKIFINNKIVAIKAPIGTEVVSKILNSGYYNEKIMQLYARDDYDKGITLVHTMEYDPRH